MTLDEVAKIVEKVFNLKKGSVNVETTSADIEEWDSLGQFSLIDYLDKKVSNFPINLLILSSTTGFSSIDS